MQEDFKEHREPKHSIRRYANGISYEYVFEPDGWISIYEINADYSRTPVIQACSVEKADAYIAFIEPVTVPMERLVAI